MVKNKCHDNGGAGIAVHCARRVEIASNFLTGNRIGLVADRCRAGWAYKNDCRINRQVGIVVNSRYRWLIEKNRCEQNSKTGIVASSRHYSRFLGRALPKFRENDPWIIVAVIRGNRCSDNGGPGIKLAGRGMTAIIGNLVKRNRFAGISIQDQAVGYVVRNRVLANEGNGIEGLDHRSAILVGNLYRENKQWRIEWNGRIGVGLLNRCESNGAGGVCLAGSCTAFLMRNVCLTNRWQGCRISDSVTAVLVNNHFRENFTGVEILDSARVSLMGNRSERNWLCGVRASEQAQGFLAWNVLVNNSLEDLSLPSETSSWHLLDNAVSHSEKEQSETEQSE